MDITDFAAVLVSDSDKKLIDAISAKYAELAGQILRTTAPSAHRTAALRLLLESKMTMVHAITRQ